MSIFTTAQAQTPGLIYKIAVNGGNKVLDPNGDGYVSKTALGFQLVGGNRLDEGPQYSEIPFRPFPVFMDEPLADLKTGGGYGHTDFAPRVYANGKIVGSPMASYFDGKNFLFRIRLAGQSTASKGYSILIDIDNKLDGNAPNPGFEFEVLLATNFDVRVYDHRTNTTGGDIIFNGSVDQYSQKSIAGSTGGGDPDYFYDFYVPLTAFRGAISESSLLRMTGVTITSAKSGIFGVASDLGGIDDRVIKGTIVDAWKSIINNTPLTTPTDIKDTGFTPSKATPPTINSPIYSNSTIISGFSEEVEGSLITVYRNNVNIGITTVRVDGSWRLEGISAALLLTGDKIKATVKPDNEFISEFSNEITVGTGSCYTQPPQITSVISGGKGINFTTFVAGEQVVRIYKNGVLEFSKTISPATAPFSDSYACQTGQCFDTGVYLIRVTPTGGCESGPSNTVCYNKNDGIINPIPKITTATLSVNTTQLTGTFAASGIIQLFRNGVAVSNKTANTTATNPNWTINLSGVTLAVGDRISITATPDVNRCNQAETSNVLIVQAVTSAPIVTGIYCGPTTTVSGISTEVAGTTILVYVNNVEVGSTTVNSHGTWTATISQSSSGTITARATAPSKSESVTSNSIGISTLYNASNLAVLGTENSNDIFEGNTSVRGTAPAGALITLFINGSVYVDKDGAAITQIADSNGRFLFSNISPFEIYAGAKLTVTAKDPNGGQDACTSAHSQPVTIKCNPVSSTVIPTFTEPKFCPGTPAFIRIPSTQGGVIYNIYRKETNGAYTQFGPSVLGTGSAITLQSDPVNTPGTIVQIRTIKVGADCSDPIGGEMTVELHPTVPKTFSVVASATDVACPNTPVTITVQAADAQHSYQLINNVTKAALSTVIVPTATGDLSFPAQPVARTTEFGVVIKSLATGCSTENTFLRTVTVNGGPDVSRAVTISNTTICVNNTVTISVATQTGYTYKVVRKDNGAQVGSNITGNNGVQTVTTAALPAGIYTYQVQVINNGTCNPYLTQEVTVQVTSGTIANAGSAQTACAFTYLAGNDPGTGTGRWTLVSKPATATADPKFKDATRYNTEVIGLESGKYVFNWAVTSCTGTTNSEVIITVNCPSEYSVRTNKLVTEYAYREVIASASDTEGIQSAQLILGSLPSGTVLNTTNGNISVDNVERLMANRDYNFTIRITDMTGRVTDLPLYIRFYSPSIRPGDITPLPVELVNFTASYSNYKVVLQWTTASELNNKRFDVERSTNNKTFVKIGSVNGNGTTNRTIKYKFTDESPLPGMAFYRLKQVDFDGTSDYSKTIALSNNELLSDSKLQAYPNPFSENLTVTIVTQAAEPATLKLYNLQGREVYSTIIKLQAGANTYQVLPSNLPAGIYILKVRGTQNNLSTKLMKQ
ncbi:T9SS type A sorting domain-containing protein [Pontibacter burrus]|uniref:T9SS type A sorting domain-containing protein n=1 Tax=Pontibacter burrus TaxID=2704466 RepID=A0A6B3LQD3_9BACT|nr:T9SS type A sorting domain-containing protein [Pontibacter burrus]NEM97295.1 T9SS type A sorting domain-containing protein [Pontibacter burrus]